MFPLEPLRLTIILSTQSSHLTQRAARFPVEWPISVPGSAMTTSCAVSLFLLGEVCASCRYLCACCVLKCFKSRFCENEDDSSSD